MNNLKLYGNPTVWHNLVNDSLINQVAHAYIFAGPKGTGKASLAKEYIKYLLKANDILKKRIDEDNFLDLLYISKQESNEITIDKIRKIQEFINQTAAESSKKFVIIDSADDLNLNAANALLKILEEPTKYTHLFLISHIPYKLLATIRSRSRIIKFHPLNRKELKLVTEISFMEDFIAGSPGRAINWKDINILEFYHSLLEVIADEDIAAYNKFADLSIKTSIKWQLTIELLLYIINRCMKIIVNAAHLVTDVEQELLTNIAKQKSIEYWGQTSDMLLDLFKEANIYNLDKKQILAIAINKIREKNG